MQSSLAIDLAGRIRALIQLERFASGRHLTAREFADRFDVSRPPVEQALQLLATENIVVHIPNRGYFVGEAALTQSAAFSCGQETYLTRVYFRLAEDRLNDQLPDQVSEAYLRKIYGLTESDLRSLINRIVQEGWAERRPGYGWSFSSVLTTPQALEQNYRVRLILEPAGLVEPGFNLSPEKAEICRMNEEELLSGKIDKFSPDILYERGVQFHHTLAEASNNPFLVDALRRLHATRRLLAYRTMVDRSRHYRQAEQHLQILELLTAKRNDEAAAAMRAHLQGVVISLRFLDKILQNS
jgi:DNA-binding GntR family transcriptional regulator